jgi:hypothetical protein
METTENPAIKADFFSVFLQEQMNLSLQHSLHFCIRTFVSKYSPDSLSQNKIKILNCIFDILINSAFLSVFNAPFTEYFYKLRRVRLSDKSSDSLLPRKTKIIIMLCYVIKHYIIKAIRTWSQSELKSNSSCLSSLKLKIHKLVRLLFPVFDLIQFAYKIK